MRGFLLVMIACAAGLLGGTPAMAIDPNRTFSQYMHDIWLKKDGLPQNSVNAIVQSWDGYIWIGTQEGLVRFDGVKFTVYDKSTTPAFHSPYVSALIEDRAHDLWIGTRSGLVHKSGGEFTYFADVPHLSNAIVRCLLEDDAGNLWIGTENNGLFLYHDSTFVSYNTGSGFVSNSVFALYEDPAHAMWIGTDSGLVQFRDGRFQRFSTRDGLTHNSVRAIWQDTTGTLWIGTSGGGVCRLRDGRITAVPETDKDLIYALFQDRQGNLWIGTDGGGLIRRAHGRYDRFTTRDGLPINVVMSFFEDREGSLWIGTGGGGLNRLSDGKFTSYTTQNGLTRDMTWTVIEDHRGAMWIGTDGGGLTKLDGRHIENYTTTNGLSRDIVLSLCEDRSGSLWVGTRGGGVNRIRDGKVRQYTTADGLSSDIVRCICEDAEGRLWMGTEGAGISVLSENRFQVYNKNNGLPHDIVRVIKADRQGRMWIGSNGGLTCFDHGRFVTYDHTSGLGGDFVRAIYEDADGTLWIGTFGGGLSRFRDGRMVSYTTKEGLFDDVVFQILDDAAGHLWMTCNKGVYRVAKKDLDDFTDGKRLSISCVSYSESDGMKSSECNAGQPAGWRARDGRLWFPTVMGVAVIDPTSISLNETEPPVLVEDLVVDETHMELGPSLALPPGENRFELHYTGLSYVAPSKVRFRYRLDGFDHAWIQAGARRTAYYTNIPPGQYVFEVTACNNDGVWNKTGSRLAFTLKPFVYQTLWFQILFALVIGGGGVMVYRARVRRLARRQIELETLVREKTGQIEAQKKELENTLQDLKRTQAQLVHTAKMSSLGQLVAGMAHEINNPVAIIHGNLPHLEDHIRDLQAVLDAAEQALPKSGLEKLAETKARLKYDNVVQDTGDILGSFNKAVDRIKNIIVNLRQFSRLEEAELKEVDIHEGLESAVALLLPNYPGTVEICREYGPVPRLTCFAGQLNQAFMNVLQNALESVAERNRTTGRANGRITIRTEWHDTPLGSRRSFVRIRFRDDGVGIDPSIREKLFDPFFTTKPVGSGTGLGLSITYGIVQKHQGRILVNSDTGSGAEFMLDIPA